MSINLGRTRIDTLILDARRAKGFRTLVADHRDAQFMRGEVVFAGQYINDPEWRQATMRDRAFLGLSPDERPKDRK